MVAAEFPSTTNEAAAAVKGWVVCQQFGKMSEQWIWRQVVGMRRLQPQVVTWERLFPEESPYPAERVSTLPFPARPWEHARARWLHRLRNIGSRNFYGAVGAEARHLERLLLEQRPDVILAHFGHMAMKVLPVARRHGVPVVAYLHGLVFQSYERNRWARWSLNRCASQFAEILVVGSHQLSWFEQRGIPAPAPTLLPCGAPTHVFTPPPRRDRAGVRFLAVSRLMPQKGVAESVRAFEQVLREVKDCRFDVVGQGPQRAALDALIAERGLGDRVKLHGTVSGEEHMRLLQEADVFVQHSMNYNHWLEGFGVSIAEASACGLPVVTTRSGGIGDQIVDGLNGFLVEPGDVGAMAGAMLQLARDPALRRKLGAAGRERVVRLFDTDTQTRSLEDLLLRTARAHAR